jgi:hypothetical protein
MRRATGPGEAGDLSAAEARPLYSPTLLAVIARRMGEATTAADAAWEGWKADRENMDELHAYNRNLRRLWVLREMGSALIAGVADAIFETANTRPIELGGGL